MSSKKDVAQKQIEKRLKQERFKPVSRTAQWGGGSLIKKNENVFGIKKHFTTISGG